MSCPLELVTGRTAPLPLRSQVPRSQVLRPAVPDDAPRLVTMFERCSPASRHGRFLAPLQHFPAAHLVDVVRSSPIRRSWVIDDLHTGHVVGVGSWFRNDTDTAEIGLLVEDASQRRGLGRALLDELAAGARHAGITTFVAHTLAESRHVRRMLRRLGPTTVDCTGITCTLHVSLDADAEALAG
jgi:GNAT superfamily N-acetyltransferase